MTRESEKDLNVRKKPQPQESADIMCVNQPPSAAQIPTETPEEPSNQEESQEAPQQTSILQYVRRGYDLNILNIKLSTYSI